MLRVHGKRFVYAYVRFAQVGYYILISCAGEGWAIVSKWFKLFFQGGTLEFAAREFEINVFDFWNSMMDLSTRVFRIS